MTRINTFQLRQMISSEEFDYILLSGALSPYSGIRQKINKLLQGKVITRVKKGLYVFGPDYNRVPVCKETLANLIYGPSCISLEYALSYHRLIPERVNTITSVTPKRDKAFQTPLGHFTYRYLGIDKYPHGIQQVWIDSNHPIFIASPEKALCDILVLNKISLTGKASVRAFLESDLRIDRENWNRLDPNLFETLNKFYRNKSIDSIQEVL